MQRRPLWKGVAAGAHRFTEADLRLYPTIVRYDGAYATLFKCCRKRVADYPNLSGWLRDVYQLRTQSPSQLQVRAQGSSCRSPAAGVHSGASGASGTRPCVSLGDMRRVQA